MKAFLKWLLVVAIAVALVWNIGPVLYAITGGGLLGAIAVLTLWFVAGWAVGTLVNGIIDGYRWTKARRGAKL